ncbi:hypothetical protein ACFRCW_40705 [Streptomyces sp. NPDC056653]|uniref:hypothetical protein n=1 Tax=Streptomyces sp. NPDC056653 TaxID=3345894 RepID=UPI0036A2FF32
MVGSIATYGMQDHLLLHRVKDAGEWLSVMNFDTGDLRELEQSAHEGYLDTSVICFLPFDNVVGIMQGACRLPRTRRWDVVQGDPDLSRQPAADPAGGHSHRGGKAQDRLRCEPGKSEDHGQQDGWAQEAPW